jgi:hypothetical protein
VHSVYSHDAKYTFSQLAMRAAQFGLDWMVFTEHSNFGHANAGGALAEHAEVVKARAENPRLLIFQGLEWYIPAAEHATVFTAPGPGEADVLRAFELAYDGKLLNRTTAAATGRARSAPASTREARSRTARATATPGSTRGSTPTRSSSRSERDQALTPSTWRVCTELAGKDRLIFLPVTYVSVRLVYLSVPDGTVVQRGTRPFVPPVTVPKADRSNV